ncbi:MAG: bis(5'-nucleosyl)-tetraphosphatase (symmetrical) YqeK [Fusobacteriaceae bacterium]
MKNKLTLSEKINFELKNIISKERYEHTIRVIEQGKIFAKKYNVLESKVEVAILLHDICKEMNNVELNKICKGKGFDEIQGYENSNEILHGFAASVYGKEKFGIKDEEILNAVKYHTIGRKNMNIIDKILYLSDAIESGRNYPAVRKIRLASEGSIDEGILCEVENKIDYLIKKNVEIHINTLEMKDSIIKRKNKE